MEPDSRDPYEELEGTLDPHRKEERDAAVAEVAARLRSRGVTVTGTEPPDAARDTGRREGPRGGTAGRSGHAGRVRGLRVSLLRPRVPRAEARARRGQTEGAIRVPPLSDERAAPARRARGRGRRGGRGPGEVLGDARSAVPAPSGAGGRRSGRLRRGAGAGCRPGGAGARGARLQGTSPRRLHERGAERGERHADVFHQWPAPRGAGRRAHAGGRAAARPLTRSGERRVGEEGRSRGAPDHLKKKKNVD